MISSQDSLGWWGGHGRSEGRLTLLDLIRNRTLDAKTAALLWLLVERKSSIVVAAAPQLAGKTTLLTALLDLMPPWYEKVFTHGRDEDFSFLSTTDPSKTYILIPELSDHTPAYLWGDGVRTLFNALERGYSMAATMHADSPEAVMAKLEGPPVRVHRELLANLHAVANLRLVYEERGMFRRVNLVTIQSPDRSPALVTLARWHPDKDRIVQTDAGEARAALCELLRTRPKELASDLARRTGKLDSWLERSPLSASQLQQMLAQHYESQR